LSIELGVLKSGTEYDFQLNTSDYPFRAMGVHFAVISYDDGHIDVMKFIVTSTELLAQGR
jgi:hypothetical protein